MTYPTQKPTNYTTQKSSNLTYEERVYTGDFAGFSEKERANILKELCSYLGLNPITKPFEFIEMDRKVVMYAKKDATEQLRNKRNISIELVGKEVINNCFLITAKATMPDGRVDQSTGAVPLNKKEKSWDNNAKKYVYSGKEVPLEGEDYANALMKAETKAKRRVTLSICGLGILDESELEGIKNITPRSQAVFNKNKSQLDNKKGLEFKRLITEAASMDDLQTAFTQSIAYAREVKDKSLMNDFNEAKDIRKAELLNAEQAAKEFFGED